MKDFSEVHNFLVIEIVRHVKNKIMIITQKNTLRKCLSNLE